MSKITGVCMCTMLLKFLNIELHYIGGTYRIFWNIFIFIDFIVLTFLYIKKFYL